MGRSPRPTALRTFSVELVAGSSVTGVRASDLPQQTSILPSKLNAQCVLSPSFLSQGVGYGRIHVDSRHLGVPRAFPGLEGPT